MTADVRYVTKACKHSLSLLLSNYSSAGLTVNQILSQSNCGEITEAAVFGWKVKSATCTKWPTLGTNSRQDITMVTASCMANSQH